MAIKVVIADDHALLREGLAKILSLESNFLIVGEANCGDEAIALTRTLKPDVVLMDINMPGLNGIEATKIIKEEMPQVGIIALTIHEDEEYIFELVRAGVSGYILKDIQPEQLIKAIKDVAEGKTAIQPNITAKLLGEFNRLSDRKTNMFSCDQLTARELEVIKLIAQGMPNKEIASTLYISEKTVKNHITNIFRKLNVEDRTQAALFALKNKIVEL
ncbi:MAG: response regulator transcription factor [Clostridia bacterium]|nr:response regulator transcription factor [Clostridia bacterium]